MLYPCTACLRFVPKHISDNSGKAEETAEKDSIGDCTWLYCNSGVRNCIHNFFKKTLNSDANRVQGQKTKRAREDAA